MSYEQKNQNNENACDINSSCEDKYKYIIKRNFDLQTDSNYPPKEVQTVRDIYPHRDTEIADLGKVYAIACLLLKLYLTPSEEEREKLIQDIHNLRNHFYDKSRSISNLIADQPRFNGHLAPYLEKIKSLIDQELKKFKDTVMLPNEQGIKKIRDRILKNFFDSFYYSITH